MARSVNQTLVRSYSYLRKYYLKELFILILILCQNAGALSFPYFIKVIIDDVFPAADYDLLFQVLGLIVGLQLFSMAAGILSTYLQQQVSNSILEDLRTDLFEHIIHLPVGFYNKNDIGEVVHSLSNEVNVIRTFLTTSLVQFANNMILIIGISVILCLLDASLFLICILLIPMLLITMSFFHNRIRASIAQDRRADATVLSFMMEKLQNVILVKLFNRYQFELDNLRKKIDDYVRINLRVTLLRAQGNQISLFLIAMAPVVVIGFGARGIFEGLLSLGTLVAFLEYFNLMIGPSRNMLGLYYGTLRALESANKIMSFFGIPVPDEAQRSRQAPGAIEEMTMDGVQLRLGEDDILHNVTLRFEKGKSYGIVGGSGSGKSSLTFLLCGLYQPHRGEVRFNGIDARELGVYAIMERVGLVRSNTKLQSGTIRENILYGLETPGDEELESVLRVVGLYDYISELPEKMETDISDLGTRLSDGQRQRLAIARALLRDTQVLILDEATSAIDSVKETAVIDSIMRKYKDRILLVISHRLSSVQHLDHIICLKDGAIIEQNNHARLIEAKGAYWKLFEKQLISEV